MRGLMVPCDIWLHLKPRIDKFFGGGGLYKLPLYVFNKFVLHLDHYWTHSKLSLFLLFKYYWCKLLKGPWFGKESKFWQNWIDYYKPTYTRSILLNSQVAKYQFIRSEIFGLSMDIYRFQILLFCFYFKSSVISIVCLCAKRSLNILPFCWYLHLKKQLRWFKWNDKEKCRRPHIEIIF